MSQNKFSSLVEFLGQHSLAEYPKEACGIILTDFTYIPCKNISATPKNSFIIDPYAILKYETNIWGFYHSHPGSADPIPSRQDLESTGVSEFRFLVGFANNIYIYWLENNNLKFERFNESHCTVF